MDRIRWQKGIDFGTTLVACSREPCQSSRCPVHRKWQHILKRFMTVVLSKGKTPRGWLARYHPVTRFRQKSVSRHPSHIVFTSSKKIGLTTRFSETSPKETASRACVYFPSPLRQTITLWRRNSSYSTTSTLTGKSAPMGMNGPWVLMLATMSNEPGHSVIAVIAGFPIRRKEHSKSLVPSAATSGIVLLKKVSHTAATVNLLKTERHLLIQGSPRSRHLRDTLIPCFAVMISTIPTSFEPNVS